MPIEQAPPRRRLTVVLVSKDTQRTMFGRANVTPIINPAMKAINISIIIVSIIRRLLFSLNELRKFSPVYDPNCRTVNPLIGPHSSNATHSDANYEDNLHNDGGSNISLIRMDVIFCPLSRPFIC